MTSGTSAARPQGKASPLLRKSGPLRRRRMRSLSTHSGSAFGETSSSSDEERAARSRTPAAEMTPVNAARRAGNPGRRVKCWTNDMFENSSDSDNTPVAEVTSPAEVRTSTAMKSLRQLARTPSSALPQKSPAPPAAAEPGVEPGQLQGKFDALSSCPAGKEEGVSNSPPSQRRSPSPLLSGHRRFPVLRELSPNTACGKAARRYSAASTPPKKSPAVRATRSVADSVLSKSLARSYYASSDDGCECGCQEAGSACTGAAVSQAESQPQQQVVALRPRQPAPAGEPTDAQEALCKSRQPQPVSPRTATSEPTPWELPATPSFSFRSLAGTNVTFVTSQWDSPGGDSVSGGAGETPIHPDVGCSPISPAMPAVSHFIPVAQRAYGAAGLPTSPGTSQVSSHSNMSLCSAEGVDSLGAFLPSPAPSQLSAASVSRPTAPPVSQVQAPIDKPNPVAPVSELAAPPDLSVGAAVGRTLFDDALVEDAEAELLDSREVENSLLSGGGGADGLGSLDPADLSEDDSHGPLSELIQAGASVASEAELSGADLDAETGHALPDLDAEASQASPGSKAETGTASSEGPLPTVPTATISDGAAEAAVEPVQTEPSPECPAPAAVETAQAVLPAAILAERRESKIPRAPVSRPACEALGNFSEDVEQLIASIDAARELAPPPKPIAAQPHESGGSRIPRPAVLVQTDVLVDARGLSQSEDTPEPAEEGAGSDADDLRHMVNLLPPTPAVAAALASPATFAVTAPLDGVSVASTPAARAAPEATEQLAPPGAATTPLAACGQREVDEPTTALLLKDAELAGAVHATPKSAGAPLACAASPSSAEPLSETVSVPQPHPQPQLAATARAGSSPAFQQPARARQLGRCLATTAAASLLALALLALALVCLSPAPPAAFVSAPAFVPAAAFAPAAKVATQRCDAGGPFRSLLHAMRGTTPADASMAADPVALPDSGGDLVGRLARELDALVAQGMALLSSASSGPLLEAASEGRRWSIRAPARPPRRAPPLLALPDACLPAQRLLAAAASRCSPEDKPPAPKDLLAALLGELDALVAAGAALNTPVPLPPPAHAWTGPGVPPPAPTAAASMAGPGARAALQAATAAALAWGARRLLPNQLRHAPSRRASAVAH